MENRYPSQVMMRGRLSPLQFLFVILAIGASISKISNAQCRWSQRYPIDTIRSTPNRIVFQMYSSPSVQGSSLVAIHNPNLTVPSLDLTGSYSKKFIQQWMEVAQLADNALQALLSDHGYVMFLTSEGSMRQIQQALTRGEGGNYVYDVSSILLCEDSSGNGVQIDLASYLLSRGFGYSRDTWDECVTPEIRSRYISSQTHAKSQSLGIWGRRVLRLTVQEVLEANRNDQTIK